jgi:hypothetical protein
MLLISIPNREMKRERERNRERRRERGRGGEKEEVDGM